MSRFFVADFEGTPGYLVIENDGTALYFTINSEPLEDTGAHIVENDVPALAWWVSNA